MAEINLNQSQESWWFRVVKGMFVGSGFIIPGVSGGALAAIFGIYERLIHFLADIRKNFKKNIRFFLPVAIGALLSIVILSWGVSFLLGNYETIILWFFIGAILGTAPALWEEAGKEGRNKSDVLLMVAAFIGGLAIIGLSTQQIQGAVPANFLTWTLCGFLISLGTLIPGLSPSNFIVIMGLYQAMADGFKTLNLSVVLPILLGMILTLALLSKVIKAIFVKHYTKFFHFVVGIVAASTLLIVPTNYSGFGWLQYGLCLLMLILGIGIGAWMAKLEAKYK
ncbi:DUF368 domain-containing protein [Eremococcus coleocola]|uniref:DUF368 domain-containing protein n=1 Tax=Eremococcus coleocola ACS-139-V-Col8 TaxID=908337 RepID=E4KQA3_9LACT|nr:DUF368 domain-containing protein [Eremococcus coleocola]EFR30926.1 hypothetical protein HMPREF9257_1703 [Eremococcus coleocola ACS-139-V-Col8]